jgi:RNA polymerase sigma-32 factor
VAILQDHVREFESQLNDKEKSVFELRLMADEPATLQEVADRYGLTRERARQIEAKVIGKLREFLRVKLEEPEDWSTLPRPGKK